MKTNEDNHHEDASPSRAVRGRISGAFEAIKPARRIPTHFSQESQGRSGPCSNAFDSRSLSFIHLDNLSARHAPHQPTALYMIQGPISSSPDSPVMKAFDNHYSNPFTPGHLTYTQHAYPKQRKLKRRLDPQVRERRLHPSHHTDDG